MQYFGGKSRIASQIAEVVSPQGLWWEPFCGGLSVTVKLAESGYPGIVSDACVPLICMYEAVRNGWKPPALLSEQEWEGCKNLPDDDPMKAFAGFGCSRDGMWFSKFIGNRFVVSKTHQDGMIQDPVMSTRKSLLRDIPKLSECLFVNMSFFDLEPSESYGFECLYLDPPYANAGAKYDGAPDFDYEMFWPKCVEWSKFCRVLVSELTCPIEHVVVWELLCDQRAGSGGGQINDKRLEKLFLVLP